MLLLMFSIEIKSNIGVSRQGIVAALKRHCIAFVILNVRQIVNKK